MLSGPSVTTPAAAARLDSSDTYVSDRWAWNGSNRTQIALRSETSRVVGRNCFGNIQSAANLKVYSRAVFVGKLNFRQLQFHLTGYLG
jgi:hypothetical protein